jgi:hypothetical protein
MSDYEQSASAEQKLNIATYFIMSAPVGECDEVVAGTYEWEECAGCSDACTPILACRSILVWRSPSARRGGCSSALVCVASVCSRRIGVAVALCCSSCVHYACIGSSSVWSALADVKKLVSDPSTLTDAALTAILRDYNTEHMTAAPAPGKEQSGDRDREWEIRSERG